MCALHREEHFPVTVTQRRKRSIVGKVKELLARAGAFALEHRELIVPVEVDLVSLASSGIPLEQFILDVCLTGSGHQGRQPVKQRDDVVGGAARLDVSGPLHHHWDAKAAFPGGVLFSMEWR